MLSSLRTKLPFHSLKSILALICFFSRQNCCSFQNSVKAVFLPSWIFHESLATVPSYFSFEIWSPAMEVGKFVDGNILPLKFIVCPFGNNVYQYALFWKIQHHGVQKNIFLIPVACRRLISTDSHHSLTFLLISRYLSGLIVERVCWPECSDSCKKAKERIH